SSDVCSSDLRRQEQLQALEHLCLYGDLVVLLLGEKGAGKTALIEQLLAHSRERLPTLLVRPDLLAGGKRLLEQIVQALPSTPSLPKQGALRGLGQVTEYLRIQSEAGRRTLLVVEDAHTLSEEAIDLLARHFQPLVAAGQLALVLTAGRGFDALWRRRVADPQSFHKIELAPLTGEEVARYVAARLQAGGWNGNPPLAPKALRALSEQSQGSFAAVQRLAPTLLAASPVPVSKPTLRRPKLQWQWLALAALLFLGSFGLIWLQYQEESSAEKPPVVSSREIIEQPQEPIVLNWPVPEPPPAWAIDDEAQAEVEMRLPPEVPAPGSSNSAGEAEGRSEAAKPAQAGDEDAAAEQPEVASAPEQADQESQSASSPETQPEAPAGVPQESAEPSSVAPTAKIEPPVSKPEEAVKPAAKQTSPQHPAFRDRAWLMARPATRYTIQLLGSYNEQTARTLIDDISGLRNLWYVKTVRKEQDWFVVLHGEYSDRDAARAAVNQLPEEIRKLQPWVRQFREVQADAGR